MRHFNCSRAVHVLGIALLSGLAGCQLVVDFDRSKIDGGISPAEMDATADGPATVDGSVDARLESGGPAPEAGHDAGADANDANDATVADGGDAATPDAGTDGAVDAGEDANDAATAD